MCKKAVLEVLERAVEDAGFFGQLAQDHGMALGGYDLTWQERVALSTGDVGWIESHTGGKVDERLMERVFVPLLSRERW